MFRSFNILILIFLVLATFYPKSVFAIGSCTATVTPSSVMTSTDTNFAFSIGNTGSQSITYVKITRPSDNFTLENYGVSGWNVNANNTFAELTGGTVSAGSTLNFNYHGTSGLLEAASADWTVQTNDGTGVVNCTGSLGTAISGVADVTPPVLSEVTVSSITSTSVNLSWTTNENADSAVDYGLTSDYGSNASDANQTTSHSVTLSGLTANTTYYYQVKSTDASGNIGQGDYNNFTTAVASVITSTPTPTATPTSTPTSTSASTATPTATPFVDRVAPVVNITTELTGTFETAPLIEGVATDAIGVSSVEFSIDGGANWIPVGDQTSENDRSISFSFTPNIFEDGNYSIQARARDSQGNTGTSDVVTVIIDRLPPRVGGNILTLGPLSLLPNKDGVIITIPGLEQRMSLSAVGGPTSVDLLINDSISSLGFNAQNGLWTGALNLKNPGLYKIKTRAIDGAGNKTERDLNSIYVVERGKVFEPDSSKLAQKGKVTVYVRDPLTRLWSIWNGKTFGQENPQNLIDGEYQYFLPPGAFYLTITETGKPRLTSKIFEVVEARPLNSDFKLQNRKTFDIGPIKLPLPDFFSDKAIVQFSEINVTGDTNPLVGREVPTFTMPATNGEFNSRSLTGERAIVTFISTWSPAALEQLPILNAYLESNSVSHAIISSQESLSRIIVFQKRGGYTTPIVVDRDGELIEKFYINSLPTHFFVDRRGIIQKVVTGVLNKEELGSFLSEI